MDNARLKQLSSYKLIAEGHISAQEFRTRSHDERIKLLWQWSTSKQMSLVEWKEYLAEHVLLECQELELDESKVVTKE